MPEPLLLAQGITKVYPDGTVALTGVDFAVQPGEVHGLLGENGAGKTTLTKILSGLLPPTAGRIVWKGRPVRFSSPREALHAGIGMVHQHFALVGPFTGLENIALGAEGSGLLLPVRARAIRRRVEELMQASGLHAPLDLPVEELPVGVQQRLEILKMLFREVDLLILDEPTAVLTPQEVDELFPILRRLAGQGKSVVFITHKLREILAVTDRVTVLRRGRVVAVRETRGTTVEELAQLMVGEAVGGQARRAPRPPGEVVLRVRDLRVPGPAGRPAVNGVSFEVRAGEIFAIAGVQGNGQSELVEALVGLRPWQGEVELLRQSLRGKGPAQIAALGLGHIPEDRQALGLILEFSVAENSVLGRLGPFLDPLGGVRWRRVFRFAQDLLERFSVQARGVRAPARSLSGGNQQKLLVGRELSKAPRVLLANQPTRGLDVAATRYIRDLLLRLRDEGLAILLVSADLDEIFELADRVAVMYRGAFTGVLPAEELDRERIGLLMGGVVGVRE
ncbi:MAG: ABC transporter ATP-binding protein [Candidatus Bipolaricaulota bacterium]|nr:ABC transporter ATP-binding protein [Candidatus Bipolaricaulota bacterium]MDW8152445.1 ABC transporter ATP-binding protein [Candidatus Bipolaricaulota bacterium]